MSYGGGKQLICKLLRFFNEIFVGLVGAEVGGPIHANDFEHYSGTVHADDQVVIWVVGWPWIGANEMLDGDEGRFVGRNVVGKFRFAAITIKWRATPARDQDIHTKFVRGGVFVVFHPMFEEMLMAGEKRIDVMPAK